MYETGVLLGIIIFILPLAAVAVYVIGVTGGVLWAAAKGLYHRFKEAFRGKR